MTGLLPRRLGDRYVLLERVGSGGMAEVFLAEQIDVVTGARRVAVKLLLPHLAADREVVANFEREAQLTMRVRHPNVVRVLDLGRADDGATFLAMELVEGLSVRELARATWQRGESVPIADAVAIAVDTARGLAAVHELTDSVGAPLGLVHRDVTPDNLLIGRDGVTKVGDFGIALAGGGLAVTDDLKGKIPFLSPEQIEKGALDARSDLFSLGVTLYWLLTRKRPFDRATDVLTMDAILVEPAAPPSSMAPDVPPALDALVLSLLQKRAADRPQSAAAVVDALVALAPSGGVVRPVGLVERALVDRPARTITIAPGKAAGVSGVTRAPSSLRRRPSLAAISGFIAFVAVFAAAALVIDSRSPAASAPPVIADAGASPALVVAAPAVVVVDAGDVVAAAVSAQSAPPAARAPVKLSAPRGVTWWTVAKGDGSRQELLGRGDVELTDAPDAVVAVDETTGGRTTVALTDAAQKIDFNLLPRGTLDVRADPYADVFIGGLALGVTPLVPAPSLVAGRYKVRLVFEGKERVEDVTIVAGRATKLRAYMEQQEQQQEQQQQQ